MDDPEHMGEPARRGGEGGGRRARGRHPDADAIRSAERDEGPPPACSRRPPRADLRAARKAQAETAFDIWLRQSLRLLFDHHKDEDIPAEWLRLIEEDRARRRSG
jgi:hypothetical protein